MSDIEEDPEEVLNEDEEKDVDEEDADEINDDTSNDGEIEDSDFEDDIIDGENDIDEKKEEILEDNPIFSKNFMSAQLNNLENFSTEYLQKFNDEINNDYIVANHPECLNKNFEEIKKLLVVKRNKENTIVDDLHRTLPILTKYEKTKILGLRVKQLNNNSTSFIDLPEKILDNYIIANMELEQKKLPFIIQRPIPDGSFEYWKIQDLEIL